MNIQDLLNQIKSQKSGASNLFKQQTILRGVSGKIEKHEQKAESWFNFIVPKQLQLPFNPIEPNDEFFDVNNPYIFKGLVDESVIELKKQMRLDPELHKIYAQMGGLTVEQYDISTDVYTEQDFDIFNKYCFPYQPSLPTVKITTKAAGQFGVTRLSPLEFDAKGNCTTPGMLYWQLKLLDEAIMNQKVSEYLLDKDKSKLKDDQKKQLKTIRGDYKYGSPKRTGYLMYNEFPMDPETESVTDAALKLKLEDTLRYMKFNGDEMKKLLKKSGKRRDIYPNFWDMQVSYGDGKPTGDDTPEIALYKSREYELIQDEDKGKAISIFSKRKGFVAEVNKYLGDNLLFNFEGLATKNIWDFKPLADDYLMSLSEERMLEIKEYVSLPIYDKFIDIITVCNPIVGKELFELKKDNKLCLDYTADGKTLITINGDEIIVEKKDVEAISEELEEDEVLVEDDSTPSLGDMVE